MTHNSRIGILLKQDSIEITQLKKIKGQAHTVKFNQYRLPSPFTTTRSKHALTNILCAYHPNKSIFNIGISTQFITLKTLSVNNALNSKQIKAIMQQHLESTAASYLHYQCIREQAQKRIILFTVDKIFINKTIHLLHSCKIKPNIIEAEPFAALRLLPKDGKPHLLILQQTETLLLCLYQDRKLVHCKNISLTDIDQTIIQEVLLYKTNNPSLSTAWLHTTKSMQYRLHKLLEKITGVGTTPLNEQEGAKNHIISLSLAQQGVI